MKKLFIIILLFISIVGKAQTEQKYYIYNIVSFEGNFSKEGVKVQIDNGKEVEKLRDDKGKRIVFKTPAGALMYFFAQGWEMFLSGATSEGSSWAGTGGSDTSSYWILRKPCTKEEFEEAVKEAVKK